MLAIKTNGIFASLNCVVCRGEFVASARSGKPVIYEILSPKTK